MVHGWRKAAAAIGFAVGVALAQSSEAATILWTLSGGTFDDGSTFSGSFTFDTTIGQVTTWDIVTTYGSTVFGDTYSLEDGQSAEASASSVSFIGGSPQEVLTLNGFSPGTAGVFAPLGGMELHIDKWGDGVAGRSITGGTASSPVQGVPEPASWALLIAGSGATGALLRRRRLQAIAGCR